MRHIILLRGCPGSGKSYFIRKHKMEQYTLSSDAIRLIYQSPVIDVCGSSISQKNNKRVWSFLMERLEERMTKGEFIIVDATHKNTDDINRYKVLCDKYRYRCTVCDFTLSTPLFTCMKRNKSREGFRMLSDMMLESYHKAMAEQKIPKWVNLIKPSNFKETITYRNHDFDGWTSVHHIGDLQGCYQPIAEYFAQHGAPTDNPDELYIFVGDLLDRGIQNAEVMSLMLSICNLRNVMIIEGNHEIHLKNWANDVVTRSEIFNTETKLQLDAANISKKSVRNLYRGLMQMVSYTRNGVKVLVTHGGMSRMPDNPMLVASSQYIKGIGEHYVDIDNEWNEQMQHAGVYQVHGHRNHQDHPIEVDWSFNLEGCIEFFGHLRVAVLTNAGWDFRSIKSTVCKVKEVSAESNLLRELRASKYVEEKVFGDVSSFNFTRDAFSRKQWNGTTLKARGLFINTKSNEIVARSYDKFFNVDELEYTSWKDLDVKLIFPVVAYQKENGFLGITGWDSEVGCKIIASKSSLTGPHTAWFNDILQISLGDRIDAFFKLLHDEKVSAVFEVIDPVNDPHIIEYTESKIVLLDLIYRSEIFERVNYDLMCAIATSFGLEVKTRLETFDDIIGLKGYVDAHKDDDRTEGILLEDSSGYMVKVKYEYYMFWKKIRWAKDNMSNGRYVRPDRSRPDGMSDRLHTYMSSIDPVKLGMMSLIDLRKGYVRYMEQYMVG